MILDVFQWVNRLKTKDFKNQHSKCKFSQKQVPEAVRMQISSMIFSPSISNDSQTQIVISTEKFVRNDEKMVDPDFVQDHSQKVPEGKGNLNTGFQMNYNG